MEIPGKSKQKLRLRIPGSTAHSHLVSVFFFQDGSGKVCHLLSALIGADAAEGGSASPIVTNGDPINLTQEPLSSLSAFQRPCTLP